MDGVFISYSINSKELACRTRITDVDASGKLRLDLAACAPQLETTRRLSAVLPADDRFSCAVVGNGILSYRLDVNNSLSTPIDSHNPTRRLRGACDSAFRRVAYLSVARVLVGDQ